MYKFIFDISTELIQTLFDINTLQIVYHIMWTKTKIMQRNNVIKERHSLIVVVVGHSLARSVFVQHRAKSESQSCCVQNDNARTRGGNTFNQEGVM